jgi:putative ATPase
MPQPLADFLRPSSLADFIGQKELVGDNGLIKKLLETGKIPSMIFWGPPASGKTSLANIISNTQNAEFISLSAVMQGKEDLKKVLKIADQNKLENKPTILFIDEIHRWNKAQQDALLPFVENGTVTLIGATTENPSFSIISALLSRCRVIVFKPHSNQDILVALQKAVDLLSKNLVKNEFNFDQKALQILQEKVDLLDYIAKLSDGDLRFALNTLEIALEFARTNSLDLELIQKAAQKSLLYDKNGEEHYNLISAVHKSLRSSNPTAGVYWIVRMLTAGEDPLYIARRLVRFASEDIGNTNPNALLLANQVYIAVQNLGMPECETALVQLAEFLAKSPKNNSSYTALNLAKADVQKFGSLPVPLHFRNAPTKLMKNLGYGKNYQYDHDLPTKKSDQQAMPEGLEGREYFG